MMKKSFGSMHNEVSLDCQQLKALEWNPQWISAIFFDASYNQLTKLPLAMSQLIRLYHLNLSHNKFKHVPKCVSNCLKLQMLNLNQNHITSLPTEVALLTNLNQLHVENNKLVSIPALTSLRHLVIGHNYLTELPFLPKLKRLFAENNMLTSVSTLASCLEMIRLDSNRITEIPASISRMTDLKTLRLENNLITSIPTHLDRLPHLTEVHLYNNPIAHDLPQSVANIVSIENYPMKVYFPHELRPLLFLLDPMTCHYYFLREAREKFVRDRCFLLASVIDLPVLVVELLFSCLL